MKKNMSNMKHLIVSSDKRTWDSKNQKFFLGMWCFINKPSDALYFKGNILKDIFKSEKERMIYKDRVWKEIYKINDEIFLDVCESLNKHYQKNYSVRFYRILIGQWFDWCLALVYDRIEFTKLLFTKYKFSSFSYINSKNYDLTCDNEMEYSLGNLDDHWNQKLFYEILKKIKLKNLKIKKINDHSLKRNINMSFYTLNKSKSFILETINKYNKFISDDNDAFIIGTYLPKSYEAYLNFQINKKPILWSSKKFIKPKKVDLQLRQKLAEKSFKRNKSFNIIKSLIFDLMPTCYLEGITDLKKESLNYGYPSSPRFILTGSANICFDEPFKFWAAEQVENNNVPLYTLQHGSYFGWVKEEYLQREEVISDKFITWGWQDRKTDLKGFNIICAKKNMINYDINGSLLLLKPPAEILNYRFFYHERQWNYMNYDKYREELKVGFVEKLKSKVVNNLIIRPYPLNARIQLTEKDDHEFWGKIKSLKIDSGKEKYERLVSKSRLVVFTYASSGFLHTMNQNIPTIVILQPSHLYQFNKKFTKELNKLVSANIVFTNYNCASKFINSIWNDINKWWFKKSTQKTIDQFCDKYSARNYTPVKSLKKLLN